MITMEYTTRTVNLHIFLIHFDIEIPISVFKIILFFSISSMIYLLSSRKRYLFMLRDWCVKNWYLTFLIFMGSANVCTLSLWILVSNASQLCFVWTSNFSALSARGLCILYQFGFKPLFIVFMMWWNYLFSANEIFLIASFVHVYKF